MNETARFIDQTGARPAAMDLWPAIVIPKEAIDAEVERLAGLPRPANGRRRSIIKASVRTSHLPQRMDCRPVCVIPGS